MPVTDDEKKARAKEIAQILGDHNRWLTHGKSIRIADLDEMRLKVTDFSKSQDLFDAIRRYEVLLRMTFESPVYKLFETPSGVILKMSAQLAMPQKLGKTEPKCIIAQNKCPKCSIPIEVQLNMGRWFPLQPGKIIFPPSGIIKCPGCQDEINLSGMRAHFESRIGAKVVTKKEGNDGG